MLVIIVLLAIGLTLIRMGLPVIGLINNEDTLKLVITALTMLNGAVIGFYLGWSLRGKG